MTRTATSSLSLLIVLLIVLLKRLSAKIYCTIQFQANIWDLISVPIHSRSMQIYYQVLTQWSKLCMVQSKSLIWNLKSRSPPWISGKVIAMFHFNLNLILESNWLTTWTSWFMTNFCLTQLAIWFSMKKYCLEKSLQWLWLKQAKTKANALFQYTTVWIWQPINILNSGNGLRNLHQMRLNIWMSQSSQTEYSCHIGL